MLFSSRWLPNLRRAWKPLDFSNATAPKVASRQLIDEENLPGYNASLFYPARTGEVVDNRYQIVGKLGFGVSSTVWLARDLNNRRHVSIKLYVDSKVLGPGLDDELNMYKRLESGPKEHVGYGAVRSLLDSFDINGPSGLHRCLVHPPLFESVSAFLRRNPVERLPAPMLAHVLKQLFLALDFLHTGCQIIHTDIKADNLMFPINDETVFSDFERQELEDPCARKDVDDRIVYESRQLQLLKPENVGFPVLSDFGSAVLGGVEHTEDVQPDIYRAPEVILEVPWDHKIDIWNVGCLIWDMFEGGHLFSGQDLERGKYLSRTHLAEMIALLGPPPKDLLKRGARTHEWFSDEGAFTAGIPESTTLEKRETNLKGEDKRLFMQLMRKMLTWEASKRSSAAELLQDEWIKKETS